MQNPLQNDDVRTPGQLIEKLLAERGWTQRVLAIVLGVDDSGLNKVISGKRPVTAEMALVLGEVFGVEPARFLELQAKYELAQARYFSIPDPGRAKRATLFGDLPVSEMIKRRWIDAHDVRDTATVEEELIHFFSAKSLSDIEILPHAAKKTHVSIDATPAQLAWLYRVKQIASAMTVESYNQFSGRSAIKKLEGMRRSESAIAEVPQVLSDHGIRFVVVESIGSAKIDGVCFWLDENSPVIGLSCRYDRIDNFWFVLRHECEHMIHAHGLNSRKQGVVMLDTELEGERAGTGPDINQEERIANEAAASFCAPQDKLQKFIKIKSPFFTERDLIGFANTHGIHPGLAVGQLQRKTERYDLFRNHLIKVRPIIARTAKIDGWGLVANTEA
ncbi:MAG TPA: HigA family addiction module antitoxin [Pyrinomonadaceae bacterium]